MDLEYDGQITTVVFPLNFPVHAAMVCRVSWRRIWRLWRTSAMRRRGCWRRRVPRCCTSERLWIKSHKNMLGRGKTSRDAQIATKSYRHRSGRRRAEAEYFCRGGILLGDLRHGAHVC